MSWSDDDILEVMDQVERRHLSASVVATHFATSRSAICGLVKRIRDDIAEEDKRRNRPADLDTDGRPPQRPANLDGGMPSRWWDRGAPAAVVTRNRFEFRAARS